jgi:hypothetical protein
MNGLMDGQTGKEASKVNLMDRESSYKCLRQFNPNPGASHQITILLSDGLFLILTKF